MKAVIMAGGKGSRIAGKFADIPKPMIPVCGKPVLEHEIDCLREQGFDDIILTVSHLGKQIMNYFGNGEDFGIHIEYYFEREPLGNAGALFRLKDKLTKDFLLLNGDSLFDVDFERLVTFHREHGGLATLFTHPNDHPYDSGLLVTDEKKAVTRWFTKEEKRPPWYRNCVNAGLHVLSSQLLNNPSGAQKVDLDRQILRPLAGTGQMFAYQSPEYVKDMGMPERYDAVCRDFASGRVQARNLRRRQRAIFLDRDGTLNRYVGFLRNIEDFELLPGAAEAVRKINESGYLTIVVTNQPVIARGEVTVAELDEIHNKLETLLGRQGAYLDAIYYCPHHPDKGFAGEVLELKIDCDCRKPKPGMLLRAAADFHIDLSRSWLVGDNESDILAGKAAGCRIVQLETNQAGGLQEAVEQILQSDTKNKGDRENDGRT